ncbi:sugar phosphate isomerase/epimerase family protein [Roseimaritima ulvae]|uniref:Xylose isomerase-like TIM barrel n=1 Tax=Roseimaritima ulvae TaxID=980254 RepID=A0A5B9QWS0_9BACT|nr:sugar phosphate isomerase/epimerase family protein [Roseimaritima ulvae]QEG43467.1 Xylose isomerase-like TIM barrel [Roseimaritima ulvae]
MTYPRRQFLAHSAAALAALSSLRASSARAAAATGTRLKLGLVTYNWGKNWDLPMVIKNCEDTGFAGVELRSTHKHGVEITMDAKQRQAVRQRFENSDVELVGLGSACEYHAVDPKQLQKNIEETKQFVKLCQDVGGSGVKVRPNGLPKERPVEQTIEQIGKSLNEVGQFGADHGVQIRVEVHGKLTQQIPHMKSIMDVADHPNVVVCWNCNPADLQGPGLQHNYKLLQDRMGTVHIHDLRNNQYPWDELFPLLKQTDAEGFTGWTLLEDGRVPEDIVAAMKENTELWKKLAS